MSKYVSSIHYWLVNKIGIFEDLELEIIESLEQELRVDLSQTIKELRSSFGDFLENKPLEEVINKNNIHGWLLNKLRIAEIRQAALITKMINKYGNMVFNIIKKCYIRQGAECGSDAKLEYNISTAFDLHECLYHYILEGMPCDNIIDITLNQTSFIKWEVTNCPHKRYWDEASGDVRIFYDLRTAWISTFIENTNSDYVFNFSSKKIDDKNVLFYEIKSTQ